MPRVFTHSAGGPKSRNMTTDPTLPSQISTQIKTSVLEVSGPGSMLASSDQKGTYPEPLFSWGTLLRYITIAGHDTLRLLSFA